MQDDPDRIEKDLLLLLKDIVSIDQDTLLIHAPCKSLKGGKSTWMLKAGTIPKSWWQPGPSSQRVASRRGTFLHFPANRLFMAPALLQEIINQWQRELLENYRIRHSATWTTAESALDLWGGIFQKKNELHQVQAASHRPGKRSSNNTGYQKHLRLHHQRLTKRCEGYSANLYNIFYQHSEEEYAAIMADSDDDMYLPETDADPHLLSPGCPTDYGELSIRRMRAYSNITSKPRAFLDPALVNTAKQGHPQSDTYLRIQNLLLHRILKARQLLHWLEILPQDTLQFSLASVFSDIRWPVIQLLTHVPNGKLIFNDNTALTYTLACCCRVRSQHSGRTFRKLRIACHQKRRLLLTAVGAPDSNIHLRIVQSLPPVALTSQVVLSLLDLMKQHPVTIKHLSDNVSVIHAETLKFLTSLIDAAKSLGLPQRPVPSLQIYRAFINGHYTHHARSIRGLWWDSIHTVLQPHNDLRDRNRYITRLSRVQSHRKLEELHNRIVAESNRRDTELSLEFREELSRLQKHFPLNCPFPSLPENWTPLLVIDDIRREASEMHHCLFSAHLQDLARSALFAFSIITASGSRATLSIRRTNWSCHWELEEFAGKYNGRLSAEDEDAILSELDSILAGHQQPYHAYAS